MGNKRFSCTIKKLIVTVLACFMLSTVSGCAIIDSITTKKMDIPRLSEGEFAFEKLNEEEQVVYDEIYYVITEHMERIELSTLDEELVSKIFAYVFKDHPEIFWCDRYVLTRYTMGEKLVKLEIAPVYTMEQQESAELITQIEVEVEEYLKKLEGITDEYEISKAVYEKLINDIEYNEDAKNNQNIISAFINKETVCQGYAKAYQYIMKQKGIECTLVRGKGNNESHVWNLVKINDEYYYVDVTWGDARFAPNGNENIHVNKPVNYNYFAITTEELERTHTIEEDMELPLCTAAKDNYYVKEGKFFESFSPDKMGQQIVNSVEAGENNAEFKFASQNVYEQAKKYMLTDKHIFDYYNRDRSLSFSEDVNNYILTVFFE